MGSTGTIRATADVVAYYTSDSRLKANVTTINNAVNLVNQITGVHFDWKNEYIDREGGEDGYFIRKHDVGVIAQEVEKIIPEAVAERPDGYKAVKYDRIIPLLIEAVKELSERVKYLEDKLEGK